MERHNGSCNLVNDRGECSCTPVSVATASGASTVGSTPGPWVVDGCADAGGYCTIRRDDGSDTGNTDVEPIATVYEIVDARLIASAPELLAALKKIATFPGGMPQDVRQIAEQAIAKAEGK